jgi:putative sigma-54 modulation protein
MKINIKATKIELTPKLREYAEEKMNKLEQYLGGIQVLHCDVELGKSLGSHQRGEIYRAEVNLELPGELIRVEKTEKDVLKAIDKVKDHLARSIRKYKDKKIFEKRKKTPKL